MSQKIYQMEQQFINKQNVLNLNLAVMKKNSKNLLFSSSFYVSVFLCSNKNKESARC